MIATHYHLTCDACGVDFEPPGIARTPHELRLMAAFAAWSSHSRDLCWRCQRYSGYTLSGRAIQREIRWKKIVAAFRAHAPGYKPYEVRHAPDCRGVPLSDVEDLRRIGLLHANDTDDSTLHLAPEDQWPAWVRALLCDGGKPLWSDALRAWSDRR